jgi:hypothetical protein
MPAMFALFSVGLLVSLIVKLLLREPWYNFILEILCLVPAWGYAIVKRVQSGILFLKEKDEALLSIRNEIMSKAYMLAFKIHIFGELVYMFFVIGVLKPEEAWSREMTWMTLYLAIWFLPALIITIFTLKKGWMVWGSKKREETGKKNFAIRTAFGGLMFGAMMGVVEILENGFSSKVLIIVLACGATWGILFYIVMILSIKLSERNADKRVKEEEESNEE